MSREREPEGPASAARSEEESMKTFAIRSAGEAPSLLELVNEIEDGYVVRIVRRREDWEDVTEEFMTKELFDTCMRTGYIAELSA